MLDIDLNQWEVWEFKYKNNAIYVSIFAQFSLCCFLCCFLFLLRHPPPVGDRCHTPNLSLPGESHLIRSSPRYNDPFADILYRFQSPSSTAARRSTRLTFQSPYHPSSALWDPAASPALRIPRTFLHPTHSPHPHCPHCPHCPHGPGDKQQFFHFSILV